MDVKGYEAWDPKASSYEALANKIKGTGAQVVFLGGIVCNNGGKLVKDLRAGLGAGVTLIGPDGFTPISAVVDGAGTAAEGMYVSVAGYPNEKLGPAGKKFVTDFSKFQKKTQVDPYAVYAAQAAVVLLDAVGRSDGSRNSVSDQLFKTASRTASSVRSRSTRTATRASVPSRCTRSRVAPARSTGSSSPRSRSDPSSV